MTTQLKATGQSLSIDTDFAYLSQDKLNLCLWDSLTSWTWCCAMALLASHRNTNPLQAEFRRSSPPLRPWFWKLRTQSTVVEPLRQGSTGFNWSRTHFHLQSYSDQYTHSVEFNTDTGIGYFEKWPSGLCKSYMRRPGWGREINLSPGHGSA